MQRRPAAVDSSIVADDVLRTPLGPVPCAMALSSSRHRVGHNTLEMLRVAQQVYREGALDELTGTAAATSSAG